MTAVKIINESPNPRTMELEGAALAGLKAGYTEAPTQLGNIQPTTSATPATAPRDAAPSLDAPKLDA